MVEQTLSPRAARRKCLASRCLDEGLALYARGSTREALRLYLRAIDLEPENAVAHYVMGVALQAAGRADEARAQWKSAVALRPDSEDGEWAKTKARQLLQAPALRDRGMADD